uniref:Uncharacterized protein n=1 Tax=Eutreptiella gymnastica TaxID=73025 RepID=A0A7S4FTX4_9EUGL|eukprot:CAMPEP_0174289196 /NCGR_PEP_ID=MMETSP0809-20121228/24074_1 /TAXON_ID=73025 ORGANISM="Eutreptiella gymnastica-like, Strain CCMP1594" /NCGR_SAMPLE_ID=MMETSP0809 /ASSEMBLY_ACC=CAM_ASM_000658 /LENGTH=180 /DNA_ID=CAMNT_0015387007 /DNA_START=27 /DNA_END=569 /DNA_ORIENTATION=+
MGSSDSKKSSSSSSSSSSCCNSGQTCYETKCNLPHTSGRSITATYMDVPTRPSDGTTITTTPLTGCRVIVCEYGSSKYRIFHEHNDPDIDRNGRYHPQGKKASEHPSSGYRIVDKLSVIEGQQYKVGNSIQDGKIVVYNWSMKYSNGRWISMDSATSQPIISGSKFETKPAKPTARLCGC